MKIDINQFRQKYNLTVQYPAFKKIKVIKLIIILILLMTFLSCNKAKFTHIESVRQLSFELIHKQGIIFKNRMESTPVVWRGEIYYIVSSRVSTEAQQIEIYNSKYSLVAALPTNTDHFISAFVDGDRLLIIATDNLKTIRYLEYTAQGFSVWTDMFSAPQGVQYYNTSLTKVENGYLLAYETCEPNTFCFNVRFKLSPDLITWSDIGAMYSASAYEGCPIIRKFGEYYYMYYLGLDVIDSTNFFKTYVTRSKDLINWSDRNLVIAPTIEEGINNSDFDMIEHNGTTYIIYADGDQKTENVNVRLATFNGTEQELSEILFITQTKE